MGNGLGAVCSFELVDRFYRKSLGIGKCALLFYPTFSDFLTPNFGLVTGVGFGNVYLFPRRGRTIRGKPNAKDPSRRSGCRRRPDLFDKTSLDQLMYSMCKNPSLLLARRIKSLVQTSK